MEPTEMGSRLMVVTTSESIPRPEPPKDRHPFDWYYVRYELPELRRETRQARENIRRIARGMRPLR